MQTDLDPARIEEAIDYEKVMSPDEIRADLARVDELDPGGSRIVIGRSTLLAILSRLERLDRDAEGDEDLLEWGLRIEAKLDRLMPIADLLEEIGSGDLSLPKLLRALTGR